MSAEPPRPLGPTGRALWRRIHAEYVELDAFDIEVLRLACQTVDAAGDLEREARRMPTLVPGSGDQLVLNPLTREARLQRAAAAAMLARMKPPGDRTGHMSKAQRDRHRDQLEDARRARYPRAVDA